MYPAPSLMLLILLHELEVHSEVRTLQRDCSMTSKPTTAIGDVATTSCERCRRRKIKCDRQQPCAGCDKAGTTCLIAGSGEKQRPVPKSYVQALERSVASLEFFIQQLHDADHTKRDEMLVGYVRKSDMPIISSPPGDGKPDVSGDLELALARARTGQLRKLRAGSTSQYFGGMGLFQIHSGDDSTTSVSPNSTNELEAPPFGQNVFSPSAVSDPGHFPYSAHDDMCQKLMAQFFREQYPYSMCVYREFFLRDYDMGVGRYYSEVLLYAICAMGALASADASMLAISEVFASQAEFLVYTSLDKPDLTLLQAMILLGYRFIGHGKASKGWLFCGMAFRLAHEMGLHLDPNNWHSPAEAVLDRDREILRRVYWAAFNADKQVSMYFGRPPALYPHESDVRNSIRIPYPDDWQGLLETYIAKNTSITAFEDGIALSGSFIYRVELYKIVHIMITDLFENRRQNADSAVLAATAQRIHVSLHKWLATLPSKLYWNQWSSGQVQPFVLHLHMLFHTAMIILHRPPRHLFSKPGIAESEDVEICYESLQAMLRLMKIYSRYYKYSALPLDFVHTLSVTAGTILMKRYLEKASKEDAGISRAIEVVIDAMDSIKYTWPCIVEIRQSISKAMESKPADQQDSQGRDPILDFGFLGDFSAGVSLDVATNSSGFQISEADSWLLLNDGFTTGQFTFDDPLTGQTLGMDHQM
ncbi:fungal-specific transcription factor domain-containing protein [Truncatella angustata]|uniref:Fungal-specific transcription factor domain-containing protein n=1 Tax=Truncatella angustata TaxID=152316 RepID=A0A9P8UQJ6_9PEZI|nr:fungal-specific transcription factor domain-containing protein [Truncatella angustata]KAH6656394.1 fungal-specific transcription factor domain-containing protein [Truncatella angustata]